MRSFGLRFGIGLLASVAPAALASGALAGSWTTIPQQAGTADALPGANIAQAPAGEETSNAQRVLLDRARYWRGRNRPELAAQALDRLLSADPTNLQALHQRGLLEASQGNASGAQQYLSRLRSSHPQATTQIAELERSIRQGAVKTGDVEQARRLAQTGSFDQAARRYQEAFRGAQPSGQYSLEYYQTLAGTSGGYEEARRGLEDLAKSGDPQARLALAKTLTYREGTRRQGIRDLQELTRVPAVANDARSAWRQAVLWLGRSPQDRSYYDAYLSANPNDSEVQARRQSVTTAQTSSGSGRAASRAPRGPDLRAKMRMEGFSELNQGDLTDAESRFQAALRIRPSDADALAGLGIVRLRQDRFAEARDLLGRATKDASARRKYADAYGSAYFWAGMEDAESAFDAGRYDQAESTLNELVRRNYSDGYHAQRMLGDVYARQGKEDPAERQYQAVLRQEPEDVGALTGLFNIYTAQNRTQDALALSGRIEAAAARAGSAAGPNVASETQRLRAKQYELAGDDQGAFTAYQDAIVADPTNPWIRLDFARFLSRHGERDQATAMIQSIVDAPGAPPAALHAAAIFYNELDMWNESVAVLDRIPPTAQTAEMRRLRDQIYQTAQLGRARALAESGSVNEARRVLEDLYRTQPSTPEKTGAVAVAMADIGDARRAQSILRPLVSGRNPPVSAQLQYVSVLLKAGQEAEAAAYLRQLEQNPSLTAGQRRELAGKTADLAVIQADRAREARNFADAYDTLYPHLAQNPENPSLLLGLARLYATAGYPDEARSIYAAVLERDPTSMDAIRGAAGAAIDAKDYDYATALIDRALAYHPRESRLYYLLGEVARARGDMSTAQRALEAAQDLRQREVSVAAAGPNTAGATALPANPFRNQGAPARSRLGYTPPVRAEESIPSPGPIGPNPFRSSGVPISEAPGPQVAAVESKDQPAAAEQIASADRAYVSTAQTTPRRRTTSRTTRQAQPAAAAYPEPVPYAMPVAQSGNIYVPPFVDPAAQAARRPAGDNLMSDIEQSLAAVRRETGPSIGGGLKFRARDGDSGLDRLREFQAPADITLSPGGFGKLTFGVTPTFLDAGTISGDSNQLRRFGLNPAVGNFDPGDQDASGVGLSVAYGNGPFSVDVGSTPVGFDQVNFVGGASFAPRLDDVIGLRFAVEQRSVNDSLLSYAGTEALGDEFSWGGVVRTGGRAELNFDDGLLGAYMNAGYYQYTGKEVEDNDMVEATIGGFFRVIKKSDEELRLGVNLSYQSFDKNLRHFTYGHGGYFSPQNYIAFSIPIEYRRSYDKVRYLLGGAIGVQDWNEDQTPVFPGHSDYQGGLEAIAANNPSIGTTYGAEDETSLGFNLRAQLEYDVNPRTVLGAAASFDNAADWFEITAGIYLRHFFGWK